MPHRRGRTRGVRRQYAMRSDSYTRSQWWSLAAVKITAYHGADHGTPHLSTRVFSYVPARLEQRRRCRRQHLLRPRCRAREPIGTAHRYGQDFWADLTEYPHLRESFDQQMTHRIREQLPEIVAGFDWSRFPTIVDVGGGQGSVLAAILATHPRMYGHLVDLEPTATEARRTFSAHDLDKRTQVTARSFFDPLPAGAEAYLLVDILRLG